MRKILTTLPILIFFAFLAGDILAQNCSPRDPWVSRNNGPTGLNQLVPFIGGGGPGNFYRNDDANSGPITLPFHFCFYGTSYNTINICNNGVITFPAVNAISTTPQSYTPVSFPFAGADAIAPFWADVETQIATSSFATNTVWYLITPHYVVVQWDSVGYYSQHFNKLNSFQAIISDGTSPIIPGGNNIDFYYRKMEWAQGDVTGSGGFNGPNGAVVGVNDGSNPANFIQFGIFDNPGNNYAGPNPNTSSADGVAWLNGKEFMMNTCTNEAPPVVADVTPCDTFKICENGVLKIGLAIWSPISAQIVHSGLQNPVLPGTSIIYNTPANQDSLIIQIVASPATVGYHIIKFYGYDNHNPSDTTFSSFVVDIMPGTIHPTITATPPSFCAGGSSVLNVTGGGTYSWSTGATTSSISVSPASTQTYTVAITNGCVYDTSVQVVVNPIPVISVTPVNGSVCGGDSLQLNASGAANYTWAPATGLSCSNCPNPKAAPTVPTQYTITGTSAAGCLAAPITDSVEINPKPTVTASTSTDSLCIGHSSNLGVVGSPGVVYTWAPAMGLSCTNCTNPVATPSVSVVYTVTGTDAHGCTNKDSVSIYVAQITSITISGNKTLCLGDSEILTAVSSGSNYNWQPGNLSGTSITVKPVVTTDYTVTLSTPCGNVSQVFNVNVNPKPVAAFTTTPPDSGCVPLCVQFSNLSTVAAGSTIARWKWEFGNGDTLGTSTDPTTYCYNGAGTFNVALVVTSDSGCRDSVTKFNLINTFSHPVGSFTYAPYPVTILDPKVQFTNTTKDAYGIPSWHWDFGERGDTITDTVSIHVNPAHTYADTGTYCVQLISENRHGCTDTIINCVVVESQFIIYIPTGFTPNGDGKNDIFLPQGNYKTFEMYIYDRWGVEVFHTLDMTQGWNGQVHGAGSIAQQDTYIYLIKVTDEKGAKHNFTGEANLIR